MNFEIYITPTANDDIQKGIDYYNSKVEDLGFQFFDEVERNFDNIILAPFGYIEKYKDVRAKLLQKYPYIILYRIVQKQIQILRVFNTNQSPFWE
jgi:plasmid stabilization system protein ParE